MKIMVSEEQFKKLVEIVTNDEVICQCGWSWKLSDGGNDPYICHKCGHNNEE